MLPSDGIGRLGNPIKRGKRIRGGVDEKSFKVQRRVAMASMDCRTFVYASWNCELGKPVARRILRSCVRRAIGDVCNRRLLHGINKII